MIISQSLYRGKTIIALKTEPDTTPVCLHYAVIIQTFYFLSSCFQLLKASSSPTATRVYCFKRAITVQACSRLWYLHLWSLHLRIVCSRSRLVNHIYQSFSEGQTAELPPESDLKQAWKSPHVIVHIEPPLPSWDVSTVIHKSVRGLWTAPMQVHDPVLGKVLKSHMATFRKQQHSKMFALQCQKVLGMWHFPL